MARRRFAGGLAVLIVLIGVLAVLSLRIQAARPNPILDAIPIGNPIPMGLSVAVDSRLGRAFILDDGVRAQHVTVSNGGRYSYSSGSYAFGASTPSNKVHVIDTRTGRLVKTLDVPQTVHALTVDEVTNRIFAFDQGQVDVLDARSGASLGSVPFSGNPDALSDRVVVSLVDTRSGQIFVTTAQSTSDPVDQHVLILDGRSGKTLRNLTFPHGLGDTSTDPNGIRSTYYGPSLLQALDDRAGRLYVFNTNGQMSVVDTKSGRLLVTRRLPVALSGAWVNERTGGVFAFAVPQTSGSIHSSRGLRQRPSTLVMLNPRSGAIQRIMSTSGQNTLAFDETTNRLFILDGARHTVSIRDGTSGRLVRDVLLGAIPIRLLLDAPHHRALVTTVNGYNSTTPDAHIAVLDTRTGALVRMLPIPAGQLAYAMAVDTGTGHLVTAYATMSSDAPDRYSWIPAWLRARLPWVPPPPPSLGPNQRIVTHTALTLDPS